MKKVGEFLKKSREARNLSQGDVSTHLGYNTPQFISNWERGLSLPPVTTLKSLAKLYKINADELFQMILEEHLEQTAESLRQKFEEENLKYSKQRKSRTALSGS
ncbi:helix-turn-helix domain-containing protein [Bdellovibrio bacteriovorus]|uniref:HTH cro/C1-type domain-containing protein n=1 Tax=Bdellovibrio bacteriovorus TaxID=959 RepID=A0A150WWM9_BDEBC|nr:helix-turn-helix transcriptional regulator [Bdellovibrio bacteriovorus]KYG70809.1 hypothetical protein AZI85_02445 [Bdellovibrio bacteriovorus]